LKFAGRSAMLAWPAPGRPLPEEQAMAWKAPKIVEISLALEINSYACAEIG
jgi:coenzyme PQQ precursor peptide PqqA